MYCMYCGTELADDANFCTKCGKAVLHGNPETLPCDSEKAQDINAPDSPKPSPSPAVSLKNAVEQTKQRSRRRVPLVVIVALALTLAAGTAFAAHYIYTNYIAPQNQPAQEQPAQDTQPEGSTREQEQTPSREEQTPSEEDTLAVAQAEAAQAYEEVLGSYRSYIEDAQASSDDEAMLMLAGDIDSVKYPYVYVGDFLIGISTDSIVLDYTYQDIDGDSIDELFIRQSIDDSSYDAPIICAFDFNEDHVSRFAESIVRGGYYITEDGQLINHGSGGFDTNTSTLCSWNGDELITVASVGYTYASDADRGNPNSPYELTTVENGHKTEDVVTYDEATEALQAFNEEHPAADSISWKKL